jgi:hypothetical protein
MLFETLQACRNQRTRASCQQLGHSMWTQETAAYFNE